MATIIPFRAIRPSKDKVHLIPTRSFISYTNDEMKDKLERNPYSFLHVITPNLTDNNLSGKEKNKLVHDAFEDFIDKSYFVQDEKPSFYVYQQTKDGVSSTGIIGGIAVQDYENSHVKVHEHTITERERMFKNYLHETGINAEPVLLTYKHHDQIDALLNKYQQLPEEYFFTTTDCITHKLWLINDPADIEAVVRYMNEIEDLYIADGHHRSASSALLAQEERQGAVDAKKPFEYFMCYLLSDTQIKIYDFNRVIKTLNGLSHDDFLKKISDQFTVEAVNFEEAKPNHSHEISMYLPGEWFKLTPKKGTYDENHPVEQLACSILSHNLLSPILEIHDLKTDPRISFVGGHLGVNGLTKSVDAGKNAAAFWLHPIEAEEIINVADAGMYMPPKSTWVEPKLRSGMTIYDIFNS